VGLGGLSVTICRLPVLDGQEDSLGDAQGLVDMLMEFLGPGVAADSQDPSIAGWQAHGDDLMGGKLLSQGFPGGSSRRFEPRLTPCRGASSRHFKSERMKPIGRTEYEAGVVMVPCL
jgi:hypothetical protein